MHHRVVVRLLSLVQFVCREEEALTKVLCPTVRSNTCLDFNRRCHIAYVAPVQWQSSKSGCSIKQFVSFFFKITLIEIYILS